MKVVKIVSKKIQKEIDVLAHKRVTFKLLYD